MTHGDERIQIDIFARQRRELVAMLCLTLSDALSHQDHWEEGCELRHWQVTVPEFESLPASIIDTIFDEWQESNERLDEVEFSGYLDTDEGHRAWGFLALRSDQVRVQGRPELERLELREIDDGYALKATLRRVFPEETPKVHG